MKHTLFILALLTATIQTFAQSPRIKLNQITKDSVTGSVLISSPTDSGMVYSRDLFISYGADTVLILGGDTLAATSGIISSVLSDGVTIIGDGTIGSELTADTSVLATLRALSDSLALVISSVTADGVTITGDGTVGSPLTVDTTTVISSVGRLLDSLINIRTDLDLKQDQLNGTGFVKATGTTITYDNSTYLTSEVDGSVTNEIQDISTTGAAGNISITDGSEITLNVNDADASATNELQTLSYNSSTNEITLSDGGGTEDLSNLDLVDSTRINATGDTAYYYQNGVLIGTGPIAGGGGTTYNNISETADTVYIDSYLNVDNGTLYVDSTNNRVGIGTTSPIERLTIKGTTTAGIRPNIDLLFDGFSNKLTALVDSQTYLRIQGASSSTGGAVFRGISINNATSLSFVGNSYISSGTITQAPIVFAGQRSTSNADGAMNNDDVMITFANYYDGYSPSNQTYIKGDGEVLIGYTTDQGAYKLQVNSQIFATNATIATSDIKYKTNILDLENSLDLLMRLKPKTYDFRQNPIHNFSSETQVGFIAQEVQEVFSNKNYLNSIIYQNNGYLGMAYEKIIPITVKAIQEQQSIIESIQTELDAKSYIIESQATEIEQLKTLITNLSNRLQILENN